MREEKIKDKLIKNENYLLVLICLEELVTLPKAYVGFFFHKIKPTLYNLIVMTSKRTT